MKHLFTTIAALFLSLISFAIDGITGVTHMCIGLTTRLSDASGSGTWTSSNTAIATVVGTSTCTVTGITAGTAIITFEYGGSDTTTVVTVYPTPTAITGPSAICPGASAALSDAIPGGTWSSDNISAVAIGSTTGIITGGSGSGMADIVYMMPTGCMASTSVTIDYVPAISGPSAVCLSDTITLTSGFGTWSSSATTVANIGSTTGIIAGLAVGTATISFTDHMYGCVLTHSVLVTSGTAPITGTTALCTSSSTTLTDAVGGGTWSSSNTAVAAIILTTGMYTGTSAGTATIVYATGCGSVSTVVGVYLTPAAITAPSTICIGGMVTLTDATPGGTWASYFTSVASIGSTTGTLTGISTGETIISYVLGGGCISTITVSISSSIPYITGPPMVCTGGSMTLSDATSGGTWSSGTTSVATIGTITGIVTGVSAGTTTITYAVGTGCYAYNTISATSSIPAITGTTTVCSGLSTGLADAVGGGTWSSSSTAVATVGSLTGTVYGVSAGAASIIYTAACGSVSALVTVNLSPAAISGSATVCDGASATLTDATTGGTWSATSLYGATFGTITGIVTGTLSSGEAHISYTLSDGCITSKTVSIVSTTSIYAISGPSSVCTGSTITLADHTSGGTWGSSNTAIATVTSGGVVTGVGAGAANIIYSVTETCGIVSTTMAVTVSSTGSAGTITGAPSVYISGVTTLSETVSGGSWTSSNTAIATIDAATGVVTGIAAGVATITYTVSSCTTVYTTYTMTVSAIDGISGYVVFPSIYYGSVKVWLISYNTGTHDLEASDSVSVSCGADSVYYQFPGKPTDSFRIKAAVATFIGTGFIPTYHTSSFYWHDATVLYHITGTPDIYQDIDMASGASTGGPGFISGDVTTGANRGTSGSIAATGLPMYLFNSSGAIVQQAYTDGSGNYSFANLPLGTYSVHPELLNYSSTDYTSITLTTSVDSFKAADFIQHTVSNTITPGTTEAGIVKPTVSFVNAYPNPTTGKLNIQWQEAANEKGSVSITDITGREIYKTTLSMTEGAGVNQVDLSGFANGLYIISVKSGDINYINKIQVQR